MALLEHGEPVADRFVTLGEFGADGELPEGPAVFVLARLLAEPALLERRVEIGVLVDGQEDVAVLAPLLPLLALVVVRFPTFRDGRGFTLARMVRERFGFAGTLRATGHLLPDQYEYLERCGFDQVETRPEADVSAWRAALTRYRTVSQPSLRREPAVSLLRRRLAG